MIRSISDWHPADIIAAIRKKGSSLSAVSRKSGLSSSTLGNVLTRPWPKGEYIIAEFLEIHPSEIWPTRYYDKTSGEIINRRVKIRNNKKI
ncbi:helix-turn-helix domain-containing protein [Yersinia aleksiciae]|uniref:helix-turn-helix domain-containing protein n=1 Tax=Yersinia aleksiciae TaxID=263819 RepID=UPI001427A679|nr:helix-turn-helix transcriptional regulator [Yersinia aleksiciae]MDA5499045.1 helix-turn-helix transcriptional regulator [Yersinia aleksiciae]NIL00626.1 transcriptional regulator [Yersinia aleksiciae]